MEWLDTLMMSLGAILANKLRSLLTLVGIVAGVASIIGVMTGSRWCRRRWKRR